ncbi:MAG: HAD family hydrolase [Protaetiibacter sp.]
MNSRDIRAVLFDLDDTLFAHRESVEAGILAHRTALGGAFATAEPASEFARWNALEEEHYHRYLAGEVDYLEQRRARARDFVAPYGLELDDEAALRWFADYTDHYRASWTLHDDARACLDALPPRALGIITNGDLDFQTAKIVATGLDALIPLDHVIASGEVGVAKPHPGIFELAARHLGVEPRAACYVGDRLHTDAIGAARAGLLGVWIDRRRTATEEQLAEAAREGVPVIHGLAELTALLG